VLDSTTLSSSAADQAARLLVRHPRTASRVFNGEAVIISPAENFVRMLNPVGSRIWELCDGSRTLDQIAAALAEEFEVDVAHARQSVADYVRRPWRMHLGAACLQRTNFVSAPNRWDSSWTAACVAVQLRQNTAWPPITLAR
jgi:hypothetical protein